MGTNYYVKENICKCCGVAGKTEHIGKSSAGWTFNFHALYDVRSEKEWYMLLSQKDVKIFDEYDEEVSFENFKELVNGKKKERNNHANLYPKGNFLDKEGNSFSEGEFS